MGNKSINDLAEWVAETFDMTKTKAKDLVDGLFENIKETLGNGDKLSIRNFATFDVTARKPRKARNPATGDVIFVPAKNGVKFRVSKNFKEYLQIVGRNVMLFTKDEGSFKDFLADNIKKIKCNPRITPSLEEAFKMIFESGMQIYSIVIDSTVPDEDARMLCNRVKMDKTENIISIIRIKQEGETGNQEILEILPDEVVYEPFEVDELMSKIGDEVNRIADERGYFSQQVNLRVPTIVNEIEKTYDIMEDFFAMANLEEEQVDELTNSYREAIGNAANHGNKMDPNRNMFINFVVDTKNLSFSIEDEGEGFDFAPFEKRAESSSALEVARARNKLDNPGGMGMMIIKKCADEINYNTKGNKITIVKHLNI